MKEDSRIRRLADLLVYSPAEGERLSPVSRETWIRSHHHRDVLWKNVLEAARILFEYDRDVLSRMSPTGTAPAGSSLSEAIRAAAKHVRGDADWAALLMLLRERGMGLTAEGLSQEIARCFPDCRPPRRQSIDQAVWDTERRRFPGWEPTGIGRAKFERHYAVAAAAAPWL